ncbi:MAG: 3-phosphoserine/phosphohydroxythreonine transaminase [Pirellulaceae bacterium]
MSTATRNRVWNFSAGPAMLPVTVLEAIAADLMSYGSSGESVMEMSHRSRVFISIFEEAQACLRRLLGVGDEYEILFLQGGARLQNLMIPMNFLSDQNGTADYLLTGAWGRYSARDAARFGQINIAWTDEANNFRNLPSSGSANLSDSAAYVHLTSNETIHGVQFQDVSEFNRSAPLIADCSSDFLSRPMDVSQFGMIYSCAQKNAGIAGLTIVVIKKELLQRTEDNAPGYLSYAAHAAAGGMYNTPPTFPIYVTGLITKWIEQDVGGLEAMAQRNREKANLLYGALDRASEFYSVHPALDARSEMNVCFRTPNSDLDSLFCKNALEHGLSDLKGHRSVGGIRASIYNAMPLEGVAELVDFLNGFATRNG